MADFPKKFFWGAATSAHQVEGNNRNDWTEFEKETAKEKAEIAAKKIWPDFILRNYPSPLLEENYISGRACDHYNRFHEDFDIAKKLGHNAHRFSIEWSRIEPEEGKFNEKEIEHYREVIHAIRERGIEPFITLWHWTVPLWFRDKGGFKSKRNIHYFQRYVEKIVYEFHQNVIFWITLNEPMVYSKISFLEGRWPPQERNIFSFIRVSKNLVESHKRAFQAIKRIQPDSRVGIAHNMSYFETENNNIINLSLKRFLEWRKNYWFLDAIREYQDFIGFNYYSHYLVNLRFRKIETERISDMGWSIYPKGIYLVLHDLKKYDKPIFITENGLADSKDSLRSGFIKEHIEYVMRARSEGVDVQGYLHWSLLDNFEWSDGFWPRFGLVEVDYKTLERKIRPSAREYKKLIEAL